jgi:POT family proton-dependent oligopeptide transporter
MIKNTDYTDYFMYAIGPLAILYFLLLKRKSITEETNRRLHIHPFSIVFWAFYEQSGGSLALFAKDNT